MPWFTFKDASDEIFAFRLTDPALRQDARTSVLRALGGESVRPAVVPRRGPAPGRGGADGLTPVRGTSGTGLGD